MKTAQTNLVMDEVRTLLSALSTGVADTSLERCVRPLEVKLEMIERKLVTEEDRDESSGVRGLLPRAEGAFPFWGAKSSSPSGVTDWYAAARAARTPAELDAPEAPGTPLGGTITITYGSGVSDPVPYDAHLASIRAAFAQALERDEEIRRQP